MLVCRQDKTHGGISKPKLTIYRYRNIQRYSRNMETRGITFQAKTLRQRVKRRVSLETLKFVFHISDVVHQRFYISKYKKVGVLPIFIYLFIHIFIQIYLKTATLQCA